MSLQAQLNNFLNTAIEIFFNKIIYNFKIKKTLSLLNYNQSTINNPSNKRLEYCAEAEKAIVFANAKAKIYYNARYILLILNSKDKIYLRLNYRYQLSEKSNRKILSQQCESFLVRKRVERLAYKLELFF